MTYILLGLLIGMVVAYRRVFEDPYIKEKEQKRLNKEKGIVADTPAEESKPIEPEYYSLSFPIIKYGWIKIIDYLIADRNYDMMYPQDIEKEDPNEWMEHDFIDMYYYPDLVAHLDRSGDEVQVFVEYGNRLELVGYVDDEKLIDLMPEIVSSCVKISGGRGWRVYTKPNGNNKFVIESSPYALELRVKSEKTS